MSGVSCFFQLQGAECGSVDSAGRYRPIGDLSRLILRCHVDEHGLGSRPGDHRDRGAHGRRCCGPLRRGIYAWSGGSHADAPCLAHRYGIDAEHETVSGR